MDKPKNYKELRKLLGRECIIEHQFGENNVTGKITGVSCSETPTYQLTASMGGYQEFEMVATKDKFINCWISISGKPKSYPIDRVKLLEEPKKWWQIWK